MRLLLDILADPWIALDKLEHLIFCAAVVAVSYLISFRQLGFGKAASLSVAVLLSLVAAGAKELGDYLHWWPGNLSFKDFIADLAGTAVAAAAIIVLHKPQPTSSATLAGLASSIRGAAASGTAAAAGGIGARRPSYKVLPTADIEMGGSSAN